jgi:hypothetical protein
MYRTLGDRIGTAEAQDLAAQLVAWHDAMVKHVRVAGRLRSANCEDGCPHDEAVNLWAAALSVFEDDANQLAFLRTHVRAMRPARRTAPMEMRV